RSLQRAALAGVVRVVENSISGRDEPLAAAGGIPGQADARCEGFVIGLDQAARDAGIAGIKKSDGRRWEHNRLAAGNPEVLAVLLFCVRKRNFVAKAVVERQARGKSPGVLRVQIDGMAAEIARRIAAALQEEGRLTDEEVCKGIGEGSGDE